jgi:tRNA A-37 threonylcarbamoyl transferase component Bud32
MTTPRDDDHHLGDNTIVEMLAGRGTADERRRMEAHAATCTACRELLSALVRQTGAVTVSSQADTGSGAETLVDHRGDDVDMPARVSRYVLTRVIGAGGMGIVFAAHDPELDRTVAVKLLRTDAVDPRSRDALENRLRREARAMAKLSHPNVVAVYDVGVEGDRVFVAMELVIGVTLASWLEEQHTLADILETFRAAGNGLAAAHDKGIIHRDFKPGNVLVGIDGRVRVTDFGIAKLEPTPSRVSTTLTAINAALGTPYYMAPEQFLGEAVDARADQFSLCVALYAAVHGVRPFDGNTLEQIATSVLANQLTPPPDPSRVQARIHAAIVRGLAIRPDDRFPNIEALLAELVLEPPRPRRRTGVAIASALAGLAVIAAIAVALWSSGASPAVVPPVMTDAAAATASRPPAPPAPPDAGPADAASTDIVDIAPDAGSRPKHPRPRPHPGGTPHEAHPGIPDVDRGD